MRISRIGLALVGALLAVGCSESDGPFFAPQVPLAYTRFINAVPDTGAIDFRFVDLVEYSPFAVQLAYRGFTPYQGTATGARHLKVFTNPGGSNTLIQHVTNVLLEESPTFEAGKYYTVVAVGYARTTGTPRIKLQVYEDPIPDPGSNVAFRVVNLATGLGSINVGVTAASADPIPTPTFSNIAYLGASAYVTRAPGNAWFRVQETTAATEIVSGDGRRAPVGAAGDPLNNLTTIGGSGQAGSVVTAYVFPRSVSGSTAPNVTAPSIIFVVDKHPR
ncbi:MAG TPA: DUF4397 domain-containing protein [Gemmatimonadaceae bacterium]